MRLVEVIGLCAGVATLVKFWYWFTVERKRKKE